MAGGFSDEEEKFFEQLYSIERAGFWRGFAMGFIIPTVIFVIMVIVIKM